MVSCSCVSKCHQLHELSIGWIFDAVTLLKVVDLIHEFRQSALGNRFRQDEDAKINFRDRYD